MLHSKRASTLVMTLFLFAFVLILGTSLVMLVSVSSNQTSLTINRQQAEFTAKSVLNAVVSKIEAGEIDPGKIDQEGLTNLTGSGSDTALGSYDILIEKADPIDSQPTYKITVTADYRDTKSEIYSLVSGIAGTEPTNPKFDAVVISSATGQIGNSLDNACLESNLQLDNGGQTLALASSGYVTGDIEIIGGLNFGGSFRGGTAGKNNTVKATENISIGGSATITAKVMSEKSITIDGSGAITTGDVYANGDVTLGGSAVVNGDIYSNGKVTLSGSARVNGSIYANGDITLNNNSTYVSGGIYTDGNAVIAGTVKKGVYSSQSITMTGNPTTDLYANGDIQLTLCNAVQNIKSNANIYIYTSCNITSNISARGNIVIGKNKSGNVSGITINTGSTLKANGKIQLYSSTVNATLDAIGDILINQSSQTGVVHTNGNFTVSGNSNSSFNGDVYATGNFILPQGCNSTGNVVIGGNAQITYAVLNGNLSARGNGLFQHWSNQKTVTGTILLGGTRTIPAKDNSGDVVQTVDPNTISAVDTLKSIATITANSKPNKVPLVQLNLNIETPDWEIPASIQAEIAKTTITVQLSKTSSPYYTVSGNEHIINQNCTLIIDPKYSTWDKKIVFDATQKDLYIRLKASSGNSVTISDGVDLLSKGNHNVFLLLDDGAGNYVNLTVGSNSFVGYYNYLNAIPNPDPRIPNLFIINNAQGTASKRPTIDFSSYNTLYGFIYAPYATVNLSNSSMFPKKLYGAVTASKVIMGNMLQYAHYIPDLPDDTGGGGSGGSGGSGSSGSGTVWVVHGTYVQGE